jgi:uncharacterized protein (DUF2147 family)
MKKLSLIFGAFLVLCIFSMNAFGDQSPDELSGVWLTEKKGATIEISKSGETWNGKIAWLKEPLETDKESPAFGKEHIDFRNPDESKQTRKIMGLTMLENFKWTGNKFENGTIYAPDLGKTYKCNITFVGKDSIKVRGFVGVALFGKTEVWTRKN